MKILITGASGFIGTNLYEYFTHQGHAVTNLDVKPPKAKSHASGWYRGSILDKTWHNELRDAKPEVLIHLAARTDLHGRNLDDYLVNTDGTEEIANWARTVPSLRACIYTSSRLVFAIEHQPTSDFDYRPSTPYGQSKVRGEEFLLGHNHGMPWLILRPTSIWGPWFSTPYRDFFDAVSHGQYVQVSGIHPSKSFGYVGNSVYQISTLVDKMLNGKLSARALWLTDYPPTDINAMAAEIRKQLNLKPVRRAPLAALKGAAAIGSSLQRLGWKEPPLTRFRLNNLLTDVVYDTDELASLIGPLPFTMERGIEDTLRWISSQG